MQKMAVTNNKFETTNLHETKNNCMKINLFSVAYVIWIIAPNIDDILYRHFF